jgi:hypothetical protein
MTTHSFQSWRQCDETCFSSCCPEWDVAVGRLSSSASVRLYSIPSYRTSVTLCVTHTRVILSILHPHLHSSLQIISFITLPLSSYSSSHFIHYYQLIQDYNLACGFVWLWNLVSDIEGGTHTRRLRTGCWGGYLDRRKMRWQEIGENCLWFCIVVKPGLWPWRRNTYEAFENRVLRKIFGQKKDEVTG